jgi:hypothetical protein
MAKETLKMYILPAIEIFIDSDFSFGEGRTISLPPSWGYSYVGDAYNDSISSVIVFSGTWAFFENGGFGGKSVFVGPGWYPFVEDSQFGGGIGNDTISSILCVSDEPQGDRPVTGSG